MRTSLECLPCFVRQAVGSARLVTEDEGTILRMMQTIFRELSTANLSMTPPEIAQKLHAIIRKELNHRDPFQAIKRMSTQRALELAPEAEAAIRTSPNPFASAVAFAIAGNILDFGMKSEWNEEIISKSFAEAVEKGSCFDEEKVDRLYNEIDRAKRVLVLGDNTGEAVFDRLLIEHFPRKTGIFYAAKSAPVINDVTAEEAVDSGIDKVAAIIPNGAAIPGTVLSKCSSEFLEIFNTAEVVISKGQGNFETLNEEQRKIWFLFQVKCPVIAKYYRFGLGDWLLLEKEQGRLACS
ncbi:MAG: ARMT1-like domain-containing protein [Syntrophales bacterium]|nr:ARMT1-like domain-containing protein [Syntrophales bacterium]